jgi:hypothetical protein
MAALVAAIHVIDQRLTWMAGTRPAKTTKGGKSPKPAQRQSRGFFLTKSEKSDIYIQIGGIDALGRRPGEERPRLFEKRVSLQPVARVENAEEVFLI